MEQIYPTKEDKEYTASYHRQCQLFSTANQTIKKALVDAKYGFVIAAMKQIEDRTGDIAVSWYRCDLEILFLCYAFVQMREFGICLHMLNAYWDLHKKFSPANRGRDFLIHVLYVTPALLSGNPRMAESFLTTAEQSFHVVSNTSLYDGILPAVIQLFYETKCSFLALTGDWKSYQIAYFELLDHARTGRLSMTVPQWCRKALYLASICDFNKNYVQTYHILRCVRDTFDWWYESHVVTLDDIDFANELEGFIEIESLYNIAAVLGEMETALPGSLCTEYRLFYSQTEELTKQDEFEFHFIRDAMAYGGIRYRGALLKHLNIRIDLLKTFTKIIYMQTKFHLFTKSLTKRAQELTDHLERDKSDAYRALRRSE